MPVTTAVNANVNGTMAQSAGAQQTPMGRDAFLKLLVTQLRMQDPMSPMDDREFISQLAQFSTLESMQNMSSGVDTIGSVVDNMNMTVLASIKNNSAFAALNLIGRQIEATDPSDPTGEKTLSGKVEGVKFLLDGPVLTVNGRDIPLSHVKSASIS